jgi:DNA-directed RNA polymerase subunit RPC12/RpoP
MIVNMACPKCGRRASEYAEGKWACLDCGNKFLYSPPAPNQTFIQSNITIHGQAGYELDIRAAKAPVPHFKKNEDHNPGHYAAAVIEVEAATKHWKKSRTKNLTLGLIYLLGGLLFGSDAAILLILGIILAGVFIIRFRTAAKELGKQAARRSALKKEMQEEVLVGQNFVCPHCETVIQFVSEGETITAGPKHCLGCGKQVFISEGYIYPVIYK